MVSGKNWNFPNLGQRSLRNTEKQIQKTGSMERKKIVANLKARQIRTIYPQLHTSARGGRSRVGSRVNLTHDLNTLGS